MREQTITFFTKAHFWFSFYLSKSCLKVGGAAYKRVQLIHKFLGYVTVVHNAVAGAYVIRLHCIKSY